ncbi:MAG: hypothetical protein IPK54_10670 [Dokdonella sp.]|uniref:hypothetical protein n=1 Tax=Dokdonella sp. TaxID=2291710 RepID=UPI0025C73AF3|nr:hypothetical protein [Dokdonella sp.]MBK8123994.1 hypothetical protein [Dokdonella sp.]
MHNPRMVDPEYDLNRQIKAITGKRKKTDEDLREIERLEWYGGLYEENGVVVQPTSKVRKCLIEAAKIRKPGEGHGKSLVVHLLERAAEVRRAEEDRGVVR